MHLVRALLVAAALIPLSCGAGDPASPGSGTPIHITSGYPQRGVVHGASFLSWDSETIAEAARGKIMIAPIEFYFAPAAEDIISELKSLNPDIRLLGYQLVMGVPTLWADTSGIAGQPSYKREYFEAVVDDWAYTTTGDTLMLWPDLIFLNPIRSDAVNRTLIAELVGLIEKYQSLSGGVIDGMMHDYFMDGPYLSPYVKEHVSGEIDLDGDGAVFVDDSTERDLLIAYQKEYASEIRRRLGDDFIQVGNGLLPHTDGELASILNGIFYEDFPQCRIGLTDRDGLQRLLAHHVKGYLAEARGRTWSIVTNERGLGNNMFCLVASMMAGCLYTELHGENLFTGWTLNVWGGDPRGGIIREGHADSLLTFRREFRYGEARMSFLPSGRRSEVVFESAIGFGE